MQLVELFKLEAAKARLVSFETKAPVTHGVSLLEIAANFKMKRGIKYFKMTYKMTKPDFEILRDICTLHSATLDEFAAQFKPNKKTKCFFRL